MKYLLGSGSCELEQRYPSQTAESILLGLWDAIKGSKLIAQGLISLFSLSRIIKMMAYLRHKNAAELCASDGVSMGR